MSKTSAAIINQKVLQVALDGNEANVEQRVGSNVYAFEILSHLEQITRKKSQFEFTVLLSRPPLEDLPKTRNGWEYQVIGPQPFWTQWALPLHLYSHWKKYDLLFTPSHYAPRLSPIPYINSVMDLAYLHFPLQFRENDLLQLKHWTAYSVRRAAKVIAISQFTKSEIVKNYRKNEQDIVVAYPAATLPAKIASTTKFNHFLKQHKITQPYFIYLGTIQPRKNIEKIVEAFEIFCTSQAFKQLRKKSKVKKKHHHPQLVIAGKSGWLAQPTLKRIKQSPLVKHIILTGFVDDNLKSLLYKNAAASLLVGLHEGFGIPSLESLVSGTIPIVSSNSSLPEVVGKAGIKVNPNSAQEIADALTKVDQLTVKQRAILLRLGKAQSKKFSWNKSAHIVLATIESVAYATPNSRH